MAFFTSFTYDKDIIAAIVSKIGNGSGSRLGGVKYENAV